MGWLGRVFSFGGGTRPRAPQVKLDDGTAKVEYSEEHKVRIVVSAFPPLTRGSGAATYTSYSLHASSSSASSRASPLTPRCSYSFHAPHPLLHPSLTLRSSFFFSIFLICIVLCSSRHGCQRIPRSGQRRWRR